MMMTLIVMAAVCLFWKTRPVLQKPGASDSGNQWPDRSKLRHYLTWSLVSIIKSWKYYKKSLNIWNDYYEEGQQQLHHTRSSNVMENNKDPNRRIFARTWSEAVQRIEKYMSFGRNQSFCKQCNFLWRMTSDDHNVNHKLGWKKLNEYKLENF